MSVERSGPQGYEYQYLVSVYFTLDNFLKEGVEIYIEKTGGEDAELSFIENGQKRIVDIQVKKFSAQLELEEYSKWISHFTDGASDRNLLTKLKDESNRMVIFVTNTRCKDDVSLFVRDYHFIYDYNDVPINSSIINSIKQFIISYYDGSTSLNIARKKYCEDFLALLKVENFKSIIRRMVVWEKCEKDELKNKILIKLNKEFYVPNSLTEEVLLSLLELVKYVRDTRENLVPKVNTLLNKYRGNKIFTALENDVARSEYDDLKEIIKNKGVLLLTGISLCGKTYIAKKIAQEYQDQGYNVKITDDVNGENGTISFLNHINSEDRLCILDDPFGHSELTNDVVSILGNITNLIRNLRQNRKLLITSRVDLIYKVMGLKQLDEISINGFYWNEITLEDNKTFENLWNSYFGIGEDSINLYKKYLREVSCFKQGKFHI